MLDIAVLCPERRGTVVRRVCEVACTKAVHSYLAAQVIGLEDQASQCKRVFLVDNVGVLFQGPLWRYGLPDAHIMFWDKILRGREELCRMMCGVVASDVGARGVFTAIPKNSFVTIAFAKRIGFQVVLEDDFAVLMEKLIT